MASSFMIPLPESLTFCVYDWPSWKQRFSCFRVAPGLENLPEEQHANLPYVGRRDETRRDKTRQNEVILRTFNLSQAGSEEYTKVVQRCGQYFAPRRNVIFKRGKFGERVQQRAEKSWTALCNPSRRAATGACETNCRGMVL